MPHHGRGGVVAVGAQRGPVGVVVFDVHQAAPRGPAVGAACLVVAAAWAAGATVAVPVDGPEGRGGEGDEEQGVVPHVCGDGLAAVDAGVDQGVGVSGVDAGAGRAHRGAAVAAGAVQDAEGQVAGVEGGEDLSGGGLDRGRGAGQADGVGAVAGAGQGVEEGVHGAVGDA